jgi:Tfp pilus assembly protein PilP
MTLALVALSKHRVGVKEAVILFACSGGVSVAELSTFTGDEERHVSARITGLKRKKLLGPATYSTTGKALYSPTPAGLRIIEATTNQ